MLRRLIAPVAALALGGLAVAGAMPAGAATRTFTVALHGSEEVPPADGGSGTARITVDSSTGRICYVLLVSDLGGPAVSAHIHQAPFGVVGPDVVPLVAPVDGRSAACTTTSKAEAKAILAHPSDFYVNVHTAEFPAGAARGQL